MRGNQDLFFFAVVVPSTIFMNLSIDYRTQKVMGWCDGTNIYFRGHEIQDGRTWLGNSRREKYSPKGILRNKENKNNVYVVALK